MRLHRSSRIIPSNRAVVRWINYVMEKRNIPEDTAAKIRDLDERIAADGRDEEALIERGRLYWGLGRRSEAIGDYLAAQKINPAGKAAQLLKATYEILDFYNKDLYNP